MDNFWRASKQKITALSVLTEENFNKNKILLSLKLFEPRLEP